MKIIFLTPCPFCSAEMPVPQNIDARTHPCPSCEKKPFASKIEDIDGNIHVRYYSTARPNRGYVLGSIRLRPEHWALGADGIRAACDAWIAARKLAVDTPPADVQ